MLVTPQDGCIVINQGQCRDTLHVSYQSPMQRQDWSEVTGPSLLLSDTSYLTVRLKSCSRRLLHGRGDQWGLDAERQTFGKRYFFGFA